MYFVIEKKHKNSLKKTVPIDKILTAAHLDNVKGSISKDNFILMDGTDISKKHAKYMEGLEFVRNGDTGEIGLGYNVLNYKCD